MPSIGWWSTTPKEAVRDRPEWMRDKDIREQYFGECSRAHYWKVAKQPDFPAARQISPRIRVRNRFEIEAWLASRRGRVMHRARDAGAAGLILRQPHRVT